MKITVTIPPRKITCKICAYMSELLEWHDAGSMRHPEVYYKKIPMCTEIIPNHMVTIHNIDDPPKDLCPYYTRQLPFKERYSIFTLGG